ncbi:hypothetical protein EW145_g844 [Phellinidium pouzarii]|uniref:Uncharacterized protein n=1 Tax=Phellinidium pouzarii TaxID=167371 RepID=A0A4S4LGS0_9AGAM|nr:hypothetical protein EW145_g844 [Phellinidium pouzarii]
MATLSRSSHKHPLRRLQFSKMEDGLIALHDTRIQDSSTRPSGVLENSCELTDVQYHPQSDKSFLTTDVRGNVCLRDMRMAFDSGSTDNYDGGRGTVLKYVTSITRRSVSYLVQPEAASLVIGRDGNKFAVNFLNHLPTIYSTADPYPIAVCSGRNLPNGTPVPEGERTYRNACTIKVRSFRQHGAFGGPGLSYDPYYTTGSDDFRSYVWKIPEVAELVEKRRVVNVDDFLSSEFRATIGYASKMTDPSRYIPVELPTPLIRLQGESCVTRWLWILIITAGVERHITVHSPTPAAPNMQFERPAEDVRQQPSNDPQASRRFIRALLDWHSLNEMSEYDSDEERKTIDFFDGVIRENENVNVFTAGMEQELDRSSNSDRD